MYIIYIIKILSPPIPLLPKKTVFCILYPQRYFERREIGAKIKSVLFTLFNTGGLYMSEIFRNFAVHLEKCAKQRCERPPATKYRRSKATSRCLSKAMRSPVHNLARRQR